MQTLPQLKTHAEAVLNVSLTPLKLCEAIYQCAAFIGCPNALNTILIIKNAKE